MLRALVSLPLVVALACSQPGATSSTLSNPVTATVAPPAPTAPVRSPAELARLLAEYDAASTPEARAALEPEIDRVAGQRYAVASRLYWHTDVAAAQAEARATGRSILSLRMLGRLDEELSCANSRLFRTILYPDPAVAELLRTRFVLHWSSERPAPRVTVDYGDGRRLETTVTGNSAHFVLDAEGRPLDVLPGLYAPAVFRAELTALADLAERLRPLDAGARRVALREHHISAIRTSVARKRRLPPDVLADPDLGPLALAQAVTVSKAAVEVPMLRAFDLQVDPGRPRLSTAQLTRAAQGLWGLSDAGLFDPTVTARLRDFLPDASRADVALVRLGMNVLGETVLNDVFLRDLAHAWFRDAFRAGSPSFDDANTWVYAQLFHTPASDPWLGLVPADVYTGLPGGAVLHDPERLSRAR